MDAKELLQDIIATYKKFGWKLHRILMRPETHASLDFAEVEGIPIETSRIDALWFNRPSLGGRQAWELRLLAETQYALFETFAPDDPEDQQKEMRRELEQKLYEMFFARPRGNGAQVKS